MLDTATFTYENKLIITVSSNPVMGVGVQQFVDTRLNQPPTCPYWPQSDKNWRHLDRWSFVNHWVDSALCVIILTLTSPTYLSSWLPKWSCSVFVP